jgi:adenosylmethionine-8-amino-7-oxononanoate aminotransferase
MLVNDLRSLALEHLIFPVTDRATVLRDGPKMMTSGSGMTMFDQDGKPYLDMISGFTRANSLGYGNEEIARATYEQARVMHYAGTVDMVTEPMVKLAQTITELVPTGMSRVFFSSGGSESVEAALKLATHYQHGSGNKPRAYKVIARWNAYHGATAGAMALTNHLSVGASPDPRVPGVSHIPDPQCYRNAFGMDQAAYFAFCADYLEQQILHEGPDLVAAFIGETVMQANGAQVAPASYWHRVREICTRYGVMMIMDEVICGFGRTGAWFAAEHFGVTPDIMTMAKAMTAGYAPMGATVTTPEIADAIPHFRHVHTYSGHAACAATALATINILRRDGLIDAAAGNGTYFQDSLRATIGDRAAVGDIRGLGHWQAIDFTADRATKAPPPPGMVKAIVTAMHDRGVLAGWAGTAIEFAPALIASRADFDRAVDVTAESIAAVAPDYGLAE